jgi:hypothetical protein
MSNEEISKILGEESMSMLPRKYHGPELKCSGPGFCKDCTERVKLGIPFDFETQETGPSLEEAREQLAKAKAESKKDTPCICSPRTLFWKGCRCKEDKTSS